MLIVAGDSRQALASSRVRGLRVRLRFDCPQRLLSPATLLHPPMLPSPKLYAAFAFAWMVMGMFLRALAILHNR